METEVRNNCLNTCGCSDASPIFGTCECVLTGVSEEANMRAFCDKSVSSSFYGTVQPITSALQHQLDVITWCLDLMAVIKLKAIKPVDNFWKGNFQKKPVPWRKEQLGAFPSYRDFPWPPPEKDAVDLCHEEAVSRETCDTSPHTHPCTREHTCVFTHLLGIDSHA